MNGMFFKHFIVTFNAMERSWSKLVPVMAYVIAAIDSVILFLEVNITKINNKTNNPTACHVMEKPENAALSAFKGGTVV